jgi:hypothetical protein
MINYWIAFCLINRTQAMRPFSFNNDMPWESAPSGCALKKKLPTRGRPLIPLLAAPSSRAIPCDASAGPFFLSSARLELPASPFFSPRAACTCSRPLPPDGAWPKPRGALRSLPVCTRLSLRLLAMVAACSAPKLYRWLVPTALSTRIQKGPRWRCPPSAHSTLCTASYVGRRVKNICCKHIF